MPIGGGARSTVCSGPEITNIVSLVQAGGYVYFTLAPYIYYYYGYLPYTTIYQCPTSGGSPTVYATDVYPDYLATDGTNLYWTNYGASESVVTCAVGRSRPHRTTPTRSRSTRAPSSGRRARTS